MVERLVRRSSMTDCVRRSSQSEGGSDTHQLHFMNMMGIAGLNPSYELAMTLANIVARMERSEIRGQHLVHSRISLRSIRACMGTLLSRGVIDQDMLFPWSLASSAKCS